MLTIQELEARLRLLREYGAKSFHDGDVEIELHATPEPTPAPERRTTVAVPPEMLRRLGVIPLDQLTHEQVTMHSSPAREEPIPKK